MVTKMKLNNPAYKPFSLTESNQANSLRWHLLYKEEDGSFTDQTGVFKCKDYFNDFVAKYLNLDTMAYGMDTKNIKLNEDGTWVLLTNLTGTAQFCGHLTLVSEESKKYGFSGLSFTREGRNVLLFIPKDYYVSTYIISFLTYLIRISHANSPCTTFEELTTTSSNILTDRPFKGYHDKIIARSFKAPVENEWLLVGKMYKDRIMSGGSVNYSTTIHNAGCYSWQYNIECGLV